MLGTRLSRPLTLLAASVLALGVTTTTGAAGAAASHAAAGQAAARQGAARPGAGQAGCTLGASGTIRHVIYVMFDNTHYTRDNPNVPSDLQQMPNLLNFLTGHGTVVTREHTPLIAHTADDIVPRKAACTAATTATRSRTSTTTTSRTGPPTPPARSPTGPTRSWTSTRA